ncbi:metallophosphoesterase family protein [Methylomarinovum tepidoasis]|nr:metallophosphoesterase [Methylomarinovum sp. IN45]
MSELTIFFAGDPHGAFDPMIEAVLEHRPDALVILGDLDLERPLDEVLASILGITQVYWIPGNHDGDRDEWHDHLFGAGLADRNLHGRVVQIGNTLRIAGLGGVFRRKVWYPRENADTRGWPTKKEWLHAMGKGNRWRGGLPRKHRVSIFPEDFEVLRRNRADILVTHEAPTCHPHGFIAIDELARSLGARWVVHGHHHTDYEAEIVPDIRVLGVGLTGVTTLDGRRIRPGMPSTRSAKRYADAHVRRGRV